MKVLVLITLLALATDSPAQISWSPAFDSNVYFPQLGKPGEWDTLHVDWAKDVSDVHNFGPWVGEPYGRIALKGFPGNSANYTALHTGPDLRLSNMQPIAKMKFTHKGVVCHFRSRSINDLLADYTIYWQLADGTYSDDSATELKFGDTAGMWFESGFYHAALVSDSTEDLIAYGYNTHKQLNPKLVNYYLLLYNAGHLYGHQIAYPDSILHIDRDRDSNVSGVSHGFISADWRGTGRKDAVSYFASYFAYYRNDPPFSLQKFHDAMLYDTVFSSDEYYDVGIPLSIHALPHHADSALDLLFPFRPKTSGVFSIFIFKGGPDFGSHRLHLDSADYEMKAPTWYDHSGAFNGMDGWGTGVAAVGDFTGTGRTVVTTGGDIGATVALDSYYVLGDATDDKADMFEVRDYGISSWDTAAAYKYPIGSMLQASPYYRRVELLHGSNKIPVRLNPKFSVVRDRPKVQSLHVYPNPAHEVLHCSLQVTQPGEAEVLLFNVLGQQVAVWTAAVGYGEQSLEFTLPALPSGEYWLEGRMPGARLSSTVSIIR